MKSKIRKQKNNKKIVFLLIAIVLTPSLWLVLLPNVTASEQTYQNITVNTAYEMIKNKKENSNLVILDVRTSFEYEKVRLNDATLIPHDELEGRIGELEEYKNSVIIIYCRSGVRSQQASEMLVLNGFTQIYNMLGGIVEWVSEDYPTLSIYHKVNIENAKRNKIKIKIETLIPNYPNSIDCDCNNGNQEGACANNINIKSEIIEEGENYYKTLVTYDIDGKIYETTSLITFLWSYTKISNKFTKSVSFSSIETIGENFNIKMFYLSYELRHQKYNLTILTQLTPLNKGIYNISRTIIAFTIPEKSVTTLELIEFNNSPISLSELYNILSKTADKLAKNYQKSYKISKDKTFNQLALNYLTISKEIKILSKLVKTQLSEYDLLILESTAIILDLCLPDVSACFFACTLFTDLGCALWDYYTCFWLYLFTYWGAIVCSILFFIICQFPAMTYSECIDYCIDVYCW